jgi:uncharacterized protein
MKNRIIGFDLARAYAIFGMFIVNFNTVFGDHNDQRFLGKFLVLFSGNSSTVFVMLAGMGVALMTNREGGYTPEDRSRLRNTILKRAGFLFVIGLLFCVWWPADILHLYGGYMSIGALLVFLDKKYYLWTALATVLIFHLLLVVTPYERGWDFNTLTYIDFWTVKGFLRNTFYNGWNPILPWLAYFTIGLYLGRLDWTQKHTPKAIFIPGLVLFVSVFTFQAASPYLNLDEEVLFFINADYIPPLLPFIVSTTGFGLMLIAAFMFLSKYVSERNWAKDVAKTGQMTLTHYISHLTIGVLLFSFLKGQGVSLHETHVPPAYILLFSIGYFIASFCFSKYWAKKFPQGPLETVMRKISK